eukprot:1343048-Amorphochlora_amoeboformis.AAC.1
MGVVHPGTYRGLSLYSFSYVSLSITFRDGPEIVGWQFPNFLGKIRNRDRFGDSDIGNLIGLGLGLGLV